ncbi:MAG TPA: efflux RND transporter periplasmic adaptor subunit [Vicinamibacterales bacterium]|nr:efflux RND transporter periplasmic adaptor subunit [Vicinamibacterales bacterium]
MNRKKILIGLGLVIVLAAFAWANLNTTRTSGVSVNVEKIQVRDLESTVTASGKVQPRRTVLVSNEASGKVLRLAVREGDAVTKGQVLVEIDPTQLETIVENRQASLESARSTLSQMTVQVENAKVASNQAQETFKRAEAQLKAGLISREAYERAQNDVKLQAANVKSAEQAVITQQQRVKQAEADLESAQIDFTKVKVYSPITGIVTQRLIEEGEMARYSALAGGVDLLAIADMSGVQAEVDVDETDIPFVRIGQATKVTIDALPDQTFAGHVSEVGNSPVAATAGAAGRATNFKVKVTIDGTVPNIRPGFTCTAVVTTAVRPKVLAVPIQAMTVREMIVDAQGNIVRATPVPGRSTAVPTALPEPKEGESRKEIDGVFTIKDGKALFVPVKAGIAGERYFEVLSGLSAGDEVIIGPPTVARNLREGDAVKVVAPVALPPGVAPAK